MVSSHGELKTHRSEVGQTRRPNQIARCQAEIAAVEARIKAGHPDVDRLLLALADWSAELRLLQKEK